MKYQQKEEFGIEYFKFLTINFVFSLDIFIRETVTGQLREKIRRLGSFIENNYSPSFTFYT
jgi:hypothetical protein